jgi:hypothetical protein
MLEESHTPLVFLTAPAAEASPCNSAHVVVIRTQEEFARWLSAPAPGVEWLQVEGLLGDADAWALAAQGAVAIPLDVMMARPAEEFSLLYRLVDVSMVRDVRVTIPVAPGFLKAIRLAAALQLPVRLLPGQPSTEMIAELREAAEFYLHDALVDAPIEFFHTLLATLHGPVSATLWEILEQDPAIFVQLDNAGRPREPRDFVAAHLRGLIEREAECATCRWQAACAGYFKWPDATYSCAEVKDLFAHLHAAAEELGRDLAACETATP